MTPDIQTIFFDVGNTLRIVLPDQPFIDKAEADLMELIQTKETHDELFAKLEERWSKYRKMSKNTLLDASEGEAGSRRPPGGPSRCRSHPEGTLRQGLHPGHHRQHRHRNGDP